jgi:hypothetical protein
MVIILGAGQVMMTGAAEAVAVAKSRGARYAMPVGVKKAVMRLKELAGKDPLITYEGEPRYIINDGLLWDNKRSKCSVGNNPGMRLKLSKLATAWQQRDSQQVRALLDQVQVEAQLAF